MGAAVTIELNKPADASDIRESKSLDYAKDEVIRLRNDLGQLAREYNVNIMTYDASDIVLGYDDSEDFERCIREVAHIRSCLRLNTQNSRRRTRVAVGNNTVTMSSKPEVVSQLEAGGDSNDDGSDDDSV